MYLYINTQYVFVTYRLIGSKFLQDYSGIFWDDDSLAVLLALELKVDLFVLLSDVDGLYSRPPSDPQSKLIKVDLLVMLSDL